MNVSFNGQGSMDRHGPRAVFQPVEVSVIMWNQLVDCSYESNRSL